MAEVSAILLAAGLSRRMGCCKQLLDLNGKPVIRHCLDALIQAGCTDIIVVLSPTGEQIEPVLTGLPIRIVYNRKPNSDMAESVRTGCHALSAAAPSVFVCLVDYPLVKADTFAEMIASHKAHPDKIVIPVHGEKRGHPTLFPRHILFEIFSQPTLRDIVRYDRTRISLVPTADPGVAQDMDTPEDFARLKAFCGLST